MGCQDTVMAASLSQPDIKSHAGIAGNESADAIAKHHVIQGDDTPAEVWRAGRAARLGGSSRAQPGGE
eukprot:647968-Pelagomonas_calceolata.AAC.1